MNNYKIAEQLLRLCEKQYRKGLQHAEFANIDVNTFRYKGEEDGYKRHQSPITPGLEFSEKEYTGNMVVECAMDNMDELVKLLSNYEDTL